MSSMNAVHPLIPNANQYYLEKKYVSIDSNDRDLLKFPGATDFEIELPQDYRNVATVRLYSWSFPANYDTFSFANGNVAMTFVFSALYNPSDHGYTDPVTEAIYAALSYNLSNEYVVVIEPGFYNPTQLSVELTNKFNTAVTDYIWSFLNSPEGAAYADVVSLFTAYNRFVIVYNSVSQKLWFGNNADQFTLTNNSAIVTNKEIIDSACVRRDALPQASNWGLPAFLGFTPCPAPATSVDQLLDSVADNTVLFQKVTTSLDTVQRVPRFYYGTVASAGDNGYWLMPTLPGAVVYFLQAPFKINCMGPAYMYLDVNVLGGVEDCNCIDETSPFNISSFTSQTNVTNGRVNSALAKLPIPTTPISQWFDDSMAPAKYYNPPAERIRRLRLKLRYHNGQIVDFSTFEYSIMLEFTLLRPQQERTYSIRDAYELSQIQHN